MQTLVEPDNTPPVADAGPDTCIHVYSRIPTTLESSFERTTHTQAAWYGSLTCTGLPFQKRNNLVHSDRSGQQAQVLRQIDRATLHQGPITWQRALPRKGITP